MAFTQNNYEEKSDDNTIKLQIFFSEKDKNGKWGENQEPSLFTVIRPVVFV